jgi:hypothetical protein
LSPRSPATCRHRRRPSGFAGRVRLPRTRHRRARAGPARIPTLGRFTLGYAISPRLGQGAHCRRSARRAGCDVRLAAPHRSGRYFAPAATRWVAGCLAAACVCIRPPARFWRLPPGRLAAAGLHGAGIVRS